MAILRGARAWLAVVLAGAAILIAAVPARAARVGQRAPEFALRDRHGRTVTLAESAGEVVIVDFWASWCMPCAPMLPALDALARRHRGRLRVLAVDIDQSRAKAGEFLREHLPDPSPWTTILEDPTADLLSRYGAAGMPSVFVIDASGTIRLVHTGYSPEAMRDLEEAVRALLPAEAAASSPPAAGSTTARPSQAQGASPR